MKSREVGGRKKPETGSLSNTHFRHVERSIRHDSYPDGNKRFFASFLVKKFEEYLIMGDATSPKERVSELIYEIKSDAPFMRYLTDLEEQAQNEFLDSVWLGYSGGSGRVPVQRGETILQKLKEGLTAQDNTLRPY